MSGTLWKVICSRLLFRGHLIGLWEVLKSPIIAGFNHVILHHNRVNGILLWSSPIHYNAMTMKKSNVYNPFWAAVFS